MENEHQLQIPDLDTKWTRPTFMYAVMSVALLMPVFGYLGMRINHHLWCLAICGPEGAADPMCPAMLYFDAVALKLLWIPSATAVLFISLAYLAFPRRKIISEAHIKEDLTVAPKQTLPAAIPHAKVWRSMRKTPVRMFWFKMHGYNLSVELEAMK
jgi:hypothetical protein